MTMELLRDGIWQFVGAALAALAIGLSIVFYYAQRKRKELAFGVVSSSSLLTISEEVEGRVTVSFDNQQVPNLQTVILGLKNSGNTEILAADFESEPVVSIGPGARILSADILQKNPANLPSSVWYSATEIRLQPILLNPGDYYTVKLLATDYEGQVTMSCRIAGVATVAPLNKGERLEPGAPKHLASLLFTCVGVGVFGLMLMLFDDKASLNSLDGKLFLMSLGFMFGLLCLINIKRWISGAISNASNRYIDAQP